MQKIKQQTKNNLILIAICFVISFLFLMICSCNSFLYSFNDWCDLNWYITIGRGMTKGKLPYTDLFDQKGPFLFFVFMVTAIGNNPYLIAFFIEVVSFTIFLYYSYKTARLFLSEPFSVIAIVLTSFVVLNSRYFIQGGGSIEEYSLPLLAFTFNILIKQFKCDENPSKVRCVVCGVLVGMVFWMKYNCIIIPVLLLLAWLICNIFNKNIKNSLILTAFMVLGFFAFSLIVILVALILGNLKDMMYCYFYLNLFKYKSYSSSILSILKINKKTIAFLVLIIFNCLPFVKDKIFKPIILFVTLLIAFIFIEKTVKFSYYRLPICAFSLFLFVSPLVLFEKIWQKINLHKLINLLLCVSAISVSLLLSLNYSNSICEITFGKYYYPQYSVAKDIKSFNTTDPTLFCYKLMDYGYYNTAGITPTEKYFALNQFTQEQFPEMYNSQYEALEQARNDFVVMGKNDYTELQSMLETNYTLHSSYSYLYYEKPGETCTFEIVLLVKNDIYASKNS